MRTTELLEAEDMFESLQSSDVIADESAQAIQPGTEVMIDEDPFASFAAITAEVYDTENYKSVEDAMRAFDDGVERAILNDDEAFGIIVSTMEYMRISGELHNMAQMAMVLGAVACSHDHMQDFANNTSNSILESLTGKKDSENQQAKEEKTKKHDADCTFSKNGKCSCQNK